LAFVHDCHGAIDAITDDELDRVCSELDPERQQFCLGAIWTRQHVFRTLLASLRLSYADTNPAEIQPLGVLFYRPQTVVTRSATADFYPHDAGCEIKLVVHND
jgi:hypothetical protein